MMHPFSATTNCEKSLRYYSSQFPQFFLELLKILRKCMPKLALLVLKI